MLFIRRNNTFITLKLSFIVSIFIHSLCAISNQSIATVLGVTMAPQLLPVSPSTATITFSIPPAATQTTPSPPTPPPTIVNNHMSNSIHNINSHIPQQPNAQQASSQPTTLAPLTTTITTTTTTARPTAAVFNVASNSTNRTTTTSNQPILTATSSLSATTPMTFSSTTYGTTTTSTPTTTTITTTPLPPSIATSATTTTLPILPEDFGAFSTFMPPELPNHWQASNQPNSHLDLSSADQVSQAPSSKDNLFDFNQSSTTPAPPYSQPVDFGRESADIVQPPSSPTASSTPDQVTNAINNNNNSTFHNQTPTQSGTRMSNNQLSELLEKRLPEERSQTQPAESNHSMVPSILNNQPKVQILRPNQKQRFRCNSHLDCRNGICNNGTCFCSQGFTGESCDTNIDECRQFGGQPCLNDGTCIDEINGFRCDCTPGFRGDRCQDLADMCIDSPCLNGAKCTNHRTHYTCNCESGWEGLHCEIDIDDCVRNPCQNNGTCHDQINSFRCECQTGFTGPNCEININDCALNPCQNNATCQDQINDYICECPIGFSGKNCEENIDDCVTNTCFRGECFDLIGGFECKCIDGWTGKLCDHDINECETTRHACLNGGTCQNFDGGYACSCREGYTGKNCSIINDYCKAKQPCGKHGTCKNINSVKNPFQCECQSGYVGSKCERKRDCSNDVCHNHHAHCVNNVTCACLPGRREERIMCEYVSSCDQVDGDLCLNGGFCQNLETGGYHCTCQEPFYGPICQFVAEKPQFDAFLLVVITCVGLLIAACTVVSLVLFRSVRKARATRGTYSPSTQEKFGNSASDLLKPPVPERLI